MRTSIGLRLALALMGILLLVQTGDAQLTG